MNALAKIRADLSHATPLLTEREIGKLSDVLVPHFTRAITAHVLERGLNPVIAYEAPFRCYGCDMPRYDEVAHCVDCDARTSGYSSGVTL